MSTRGNVALQAGAVVAFAVLRLTAGGWNTVLFVITVVGPALLLVPPSLALGALRRRRLRPAVAVPFVWTAVWLVIGGAIYPDFADSQGSWLPIHVLIGADSRTNPVGQAPEWATIVGNVALLSYIAGVVWTVGALILTREPRQPDKPKAGRAA